MVDISIQLLEDIEEELGMGDFSTEDIKAIGDRLAKRMHDIADALVVLEANGWHWTTGVRDVYLFKELTEKQAIEELKNLNVPKYLFRDFLHIDNTGKPM